MKDKKWKKRLPIAEVTLSDSYFWLLLTPPLVGDSTDVSHVDAHEWDLSTVIVFNESFNSPSSPDTEFPSRWCKATTLLKINWAAGSDFKTGSEMSWKEFFTKLTIPLGGSVITG